MDRRTTGVFLFEIESQCRLAAVFANQLHELTDDENLTSSSPTWTDEVWAAVQGILAAAAMLNKLLWGQAGKFAAERAELRDMLGVEDDSPLGDPDVRNDFEHFDERLVHFVEKAIAEGRPPNNISFRGLGDKLGVDLVLHHFDFQTGIVSFRDHETSLHDILDEIRRILPLIADPWIVMVSGEDEG
jgi:hypothetical protein